MMTDSERVLEIIRVKGLNNIQFCNATGISSATLSHITSGRSNPTLPILRNIINGFPDLNPMWVYTGEGDMFKNGVDGAAVPSDEGQTASGSVVERTSDISYPQSAAQAVGKTVSQVDPKAGSQRSMSELFGGMDAFSQGIKPSETGASSSGMSVLSAGMGVSGASLTDVVRETLVQVLPPKPRERQITEIRIFFDDGTYESFAGKK